MKLKEELFFDFARVISALFILYAIIEVPSWLDYHAEVVPVEPYTNTLLSPLDFAAIEPPPFYSTPTPLSSEVRNNTSALEYNLVGLLPNRDLEENELVSWQVSHNKWTIHPNNNIAFLWFSIPDNKIVELSFSVQSATPSIVFGVFLEDLDNDNYLLFGSGSSGDVLVTIDPYSHNVTTTRVNTLSRTLNSEYYYVLESVNGNVVINDVYLNNVGDHGVGIGVMGNEMSFARITLESFKVYAIH